MPSARTPGSHRIPSRQAGATYLGFYGTGGAQVHTVTMTTHAAAGGFAVGEFGVAARVWITSAANDTVNYGSPMHFTVTTSSGGTPPGSGPSRWPSPSKARSGSTLSRGACGECGPGGRGQWR